jgi:hypothetical protein
MTLRNYLASAAHSSYVRQGARQRRGQVLCNRRVDGPYAHLPNWLIQGSDLTPEAYRVLTYIASLPLDWKLRSEKASRCAGSAETPATKRSTSTKVAPWRGTSSCATRRVAGSGTDAGSSRSRPTVGGARHPATINECTRGETVDAAASEAVAATAWRFKSFRVHQQLLASPSGQGIGLTHRHSRVRVLERAPALPIADPTLPRVLLRRDVATRCPAVESDRVVFEVVGTLSRSAGHRCACSGGA